MIKLVAFAVAGFSAGLWLHPASAILQLEVERAKMHAISGDLMDARDNYGLLSGDLWAANVKVVEARKRLERARLAYKFGPELDI